MACAGRPVGRPRRAHCRVGRRGGLFGHDDSSARLGDGRGDSGLAVRCMPVVQSLRHCRADGEYEQDSWQRTHLVMVDFFDGAQPRNACDNR